MGAMQKTITPIDGSLYVERPYNSAARSPRPWPRRGRLPRPGAACPSPSAPGC